MAKGKKVMSERGLLDYTAPGLVWVVEDRCGECDSCVVGVFTTLRRAKSAMKPDNCSPDGWFVAYTTRLDSDGVIPDFPELLDRLGHHPFYVYGPSGKRLRRQPMG